jgi:hypothetical protein
MTLIELSKYLPYHLRVRYKDSEDTVLSLSTANKVSTFYFENLDINECKPLLRSFKQLKDQKFDSLLRKIGALATGSETVEEDLDSIELKHSKNELTINLFPEIAIIIGCQPKINQWYFEYFNEDERTDQISNISFILELLYENNFAVNIASDQYEELYD